MIDWLRALAPYHDYGWFLALLTWAATAFVGRTTLRGQREWAWLPWIAWPAAVAAFVELMAFAWPADSIVRGVGRLPEDFLLGSCLATAAAGLIRALPVRGTLRAIAAIAMFVAAGWRIESPEMGAVIIVGAASLAAVVLALDPERSRSARVVLLFAVAALWLSSAGPIAGAGVQPRRTVGFGEWSVMWSAAQAIAGSVACLSALAPWFADVENRREWRAFLIGCGAWLVLGLGLAAWMSSSARRNFETQALARARMAAAMVDKSLLAQVIDKDFQIGIVTQHRRPNDGSFLQEAVVNKLGSSAAIALKRQMAAIEEVGLNGNFIAVHVPRAGWIAGFTSARYSSPKKTQLKVVVWRETDEELLDWADRRTRFLSLFLDWSAPSEQIIRARAPLIGGEGRMLGWLYVEFARREWVEAQVVTRLQAFVIVGLGLGIATLVTMQRVRTREREVARTAAMAATEADLLKTSFLAKVSHELRTPIQSVLGYSDLLRSAITEPVARGRLKALRQHGELMLRLVNDLLDLSAIQAGAFRLIEKPTAFAELATQTVESLRPRAESKGLALSMTIEPAVPTWAMVDGGRVRQVMLNLVGNAIKFTDRGRVEVALERGPAEQEVTLIVRDTGPGIAAADIGRLFRSFERLDATAAKEGTGLGLALSAALCRGMDGDISVESTLGEGATFRARFRAPPCEAVLMAGSSAGLPPLSGRRVLLADDNALVRELFVASLNDAGAACVAVEDGEAALAAALTEDFDAIVLDLAMPRLGGVEAARRLRVTHGRGLRIVGLSAHAGAHEREDALAAGMDAFLVKPVDLGELVAALAPAVTTRPPVETGRAELLERLKAQFRGAAAAEGAAIAAAIATRDYEVARARAHHLLNSAAVVRDDWLFAACASVERAAFAGDPAALTAAWQTCEAALEPWTRPVEAKKILSVN